MLKNILEKICYNLVLNPFTISLALDASKNLSELNENVLKRNELLLNYKVNSKNKF